MLLRYWEIDIFHNLGSTIFSGYDRLSDLESPWIIDNISLLKMG
jgi:hypothetical protein